MDYRAEYQKKLTTADEAVKTVRSGDWIDFGCCVATVDELDKALAARWKELTDVKVRGCFVIKKPAIMKVPDVKEHFTWNTWHMSSVERKMVADGSTFHSPMRYMELPRYYRENVEPIHVAMFQVSPMDADGCFSFGPSTSHMAAVCERSEIIIVEVNRNMPRCLGDKEHCVHISQVDMVVEGENPPLPQLSGIPATDVDKAVAGLIIGDIPDGACLQLGIGGMPNTLGSLIIQSDLKDLGVHTEMYVDSFVDMSMAGKINGSKKSVNRFRQTYAFGAGTQKLYDFLHNNPECMSAPSDYTNDVQVIAQIDNFISINNAVNVDLFGQVNAESDGTKQISGTGGQLDFMLGAYLSKGGKSFICCSSTYKDKTGQLKSRILPTLAPGSIVTDTRVCIQYLVTEFGKVNLKGCSTWERAERIISISHPDFRDRLICEAERMNIWRRSNK